MFSSKNINFETEQRSLGDVSKYMMGELNKTLSLYMDETSPGAKSNRKYNQDLKECDLKRILDKQDELIDLRLIDSGLKLGRKDTLDGAIVSNTESFIQSGMNVTSL